MYIKYEYAQTNEIAAVEICHGAFLQFQRKCELFFQCVIFFFQKFAPKKAL